MKNGSRYIAGAILVILGILVIFGNLGFIDMSWIFRLTAPMIILGIAFVFFLCYLSRRPNGSGFLVPSGILLTVGITILLSETFSYNLFWSGFIAAPAVGLSLLYAFGKRTPGLLVPIGILFTVAGICFFSHIFNAWDVLWPGFILSPAVGLFLLYLKGSHHPGLLIPIFILTAISVVFFTMTSMHRFGWILKYLVGGVLVLAGFVTILKRPEKDTP